MKQITIKINKDDKMSDIYRKYKKMNHIYKSINKIFPANNADLEINLLRRKIIIAPSNQYFSCENSKC